MQLLPRSLTLATIALVAAITVLPAQNSPADGPGFTPIFDGKSLSGWEGDPKYWRIEDGNLVGEITPETIVKQNTFIIWRGGSPADFELKLEYRISARGNSGINYRSTEVLARIAKTVESVDLIRAHRVGSLASRA